MRIKHYVIGVLTGAAALVLGMTGALAGHHFTPPPPGMYSLNGTLEAHVGFLSTDECEATAFVSLDSSVSGTVKDLNLTGTTLCNNANVIDLPYSLSRSAGSHTLTVKDVNVSTSIGECTGDLDGRMMTVAGNVSRVLYNTAFSTLRHQSGAECEVEGHLDF